MIYALLSHIRVGQYYCNIAVIVSHGFWNGSIAVIAIYTAIYHSQSFVLYLHFYSVTTNIDTYTSV